MATCWYCESFAEDGATHCKFCGTTHPAAKPRWLAVLDAVPLPDDKDGLPAFGPLYLTWEIIFVMLGLLYWPWWAALGAVFIGLVVAVPATLVTSVLAQQAARLWLTARSRLLRRTHRTGLFALEERTKQRLCEDQEAFDTLVGIMYREKRYRDLAPEESVVEYRKTRVLPAFGRLVRLSVSALLEIELCQLLNQCEEICEGATDCEHKELNSRYERLEAMQCNLGRIRSRWSEYIQRRIAAPEVSVTTEAICGCFDPQLPADTPLLAPEDLARLQRAKDTLRQLRHTLHHTQELLLLKSARPLDRDEDGSRTVGSQINAMSTLLKEVQTSDRLSELEQEYQRIAAEQRVIQDTREFQRRPTEIVCLDNQVAPHESGGPKNRIDGPGILSNSQLRH